MSWHDKILSCLVTCDMSCLDMSWYDKILSCLVTCHMSCLDMSWHDKILSCSVTCDMESESIAVFFFPRPSLTARPATTPAAWPDKPQIKNKTLSSMEAIQASSCLPFLWPRSSSAARATAAWMWPRTSAAWSCPASTSWPVSKYKDYHY